MAVLTTMDGGDGERLRYGRIEACRALDRLRNKVRIFHQNGCVAWKDGNKYPSLSLLDQILVPIRLTGRGSFHPKVWLVRQLDNQQEERYVLIISSRNITTSTDWDLGIALEGRPDGKGKVLPRVRAFVEHVLRLAGDLDRMETFGNLDSVRWSLPPNVRDMDFDFQSGGSDAGELHHVWNTFPSAPSQVLIISPFIDSYMVATAAARWSSVPKCRLVAGTEGLITVALSKQREALHHLNPLQMAAATGAPKPIEPELGEEQDDEIEEERALHAKVLCLSGNGRCTLLLGSHNLTRSGWSGPSTEAHIRIEGDPELGDPLWEWMASQGQSFDFPDPSTLPTQSSLLAEVRRGLHGALFHLEDRGPDQSSILSIVEPSTLKLPNGVTLNVARYSVPREAVTFPSGSSSAEIPGCMELMRTRFIVCTLKHEGDEEAWIATADISPPLGGQRDRDLMAKLLGIREFLAYLHSLSSGDAISGTPEGDETEPPYSWSSSRKDASNAPFVDLEGILRQAVSDPKAFEEMDRAVNRYGESIRNVSLSPEDIALLDRFLEAWKAIREGLYP
jgi:hypothetical protein